MSALLVLFVAVGCDGVPTVEDGGDVDAGRVDEDAGAHVEPDGGDGDGDGGAPDAGLTDGGVDAGVIDAGVVVFDDGPIFARDVMHTISITMDPAQFETLRSQTRSWADIFGDETCMDQPFAQPFSWFTSSTVVIDGESLVDVGVRKKGFLGSLSEDRPGLKLDFDRVIDGQHYLGRERLALNNSVQDESFIRQCLTYDVFRAASIPAPRCSFTTVTVNDEDLGVYVIVEDVKKDFLARHFDDDDGELVEGTLSDFVPSWSNTFERKTDEELGIPPFIDEITLAIDGPDDTLMATLGSVLDVDKFIQFWAMEVIVLHWDGYTGNRNNFYAHRDETTGLVTFIPWGTDGALNVDNNGGNAPNLYLNGRLARRLMAHPEGRARYIDAVQTLLDTVWNEDDILASAAAMRDLILPALDADTATIAASTIAEVMSLVESRRASLAGVVDLPVIPFDNNGDTICMESVGAVDVTFSAVWPNAGMAPGATSGTMTINDDTYNMDGQLITGDDDGVRSLFYFVPVTPGYSIWLSTALPTDITADATSFALGSDVDMWFGWYGNAEQEWWTTGVITDGALVLDAGPRGVGDVMSGNLAGAVLSW